MFSVDEYSRNPISVVLLIIDAQTWEKRVFFFIPTTTEPHSKVKSIFGVVECFF